MGIHLTDWWHSSRTADHATINTDVSYSFCWMSLSWKSTQSLELTLQFQIRCSISVRKTPRTRLILRFRFNCAACIQQESSAATSTIRDEAFATVNLPHPHQTETNFWFDLIVVRFGRIRMNLVHTFKEKMLDARMNSGGSGWFALICSLRNHVVSETKRSNDCSRILYFLTRQKRLLLILIVEKLSSRSDFAHEAWKLLDNKKPQKVEFGISFLLHSSHVNAKREVTQYLNIRKSMQR